jgi:transcription initiation factor TFIIIB Brf1 subunit/transcription initiation factor TFIIB
MEHCPRCGSAEITVRPSGMRVCVPCGHVWQYQHPKKERHVWQYQHPKKERPTP